MPHSKFFIDFHRFYLQRALFSLFMAEKQNSLAQQRSARLAIIHQLFYGQLENKKPNHSHQRASPPASIQMKKATTATHTIIARQPTPANSNVLREGFFSACSSPSIGPGGT
jgi:hypothetical protein